jgi:hypothetical protein
MTDQRGLADILSPKSFLSGDGFTNCDYRSAAIKNFQSQKDLAEIAKNDPSTAVRSAATEKLLDQTILAELTKDTSHFVRISAILPLNDTKLLFQIAKNKNEFCGVRYAANMRLCDLGASAVPLSGLL